MGQGVINKEELEMTHRTQTFDIRIAPDVRPVPSIPVLREILIWNRAWQEVRCLRRQTDEALSDMGLTRADSDSVTVAQVAARLRNRL
jgi:uncharacterized protein YjiS (DUF1127 family)